MKRVFLILVAMLAVTLAQAQNNIEEEISRHLVRANVCIEMNFIDDAIKEYEEIVKIAPNWPNVYMYLGNSYSQKGDNASIGKAIEYYNKFLQMTNDQELYQEARNNLSRLEMMAEIKDRENVKIGNLIGTWKTEWYNKHNGKPLFVFEILETPTPGKYQIKLSPQGEYFNDVVNNVAYSDIINDKIAWNTTFQKTYIPSQSKYNALGGFLNYLAGDKMLLSVVANTAVEALREQDVGFTDFREYNFITDINQKMSRYQDANLDDGLNHECLAGNVQIKLEHHQNGVNKVIVDSITHCNFFKGDSYPVLLKIEKHGRKYVYGDYTFKKLYPNGFKQTSLYDVLKLGGYIDDAELKRAMKKFDVYDGFGIGLCGAGLITGLCSLVPFIKYENNTAGFIMAGCGVASFGAGLALGIIGSKAKIKKLIPLHNQRVDQKRESLKKEISFGMTPTGVGMSINF